MAISTYSELQTAVTNWLHRSDLTAIIPDFITLAESRINRTLQLPTKEIEVSLTASIGSRTIALPSGYVSPIALWLTYWQPRNQMVYVPPDQIPVTGSLATPVYWTIDGGNIAFDSLADKAYTFTFRYLSVLALSASTSTNWLLTNHPDVYLYGALIEASPYTRDDNRISLWKTAFDVAIQEVQAKEIRGEALATLSVDPALLAGGFPVRNILGG